MSLTLQSTVPLVNAVNLSRGPVSIPMLGVGLYEIPAAAAQTVAQCSYDLGARHFDTAQIYGNESDLGHWMASQNVPRADLFITTKIWNANQGRERTLSSFRESLRKLQVCSVSCVRTIIVAVWEQKTDYVDMLLIHWPVEGRRLETWDAMRSILESGQVRAIGVSNYMERHLTELFEHCDVRPAVNQVEFSPFTYQRGLFDYCTRHNIIVEAYSPLTRGKKLNDTRLSEIASHYPGKTSAQLLIRWCLQRGCVTLPRSSSERHLRENLDVFGFSITDADMAALDRLHCSSVSMASKRLNFFLVIFRADYRAGWDPSNAP